MLALVTRHDSPRLRYALQLVFENILGIPIVMSGAGSPAPDNCLATLHYGSEGTDVCIHIPCSGWLDQTDLKPISPAMGFQAEIPLYFYQPDTHAALPFDLFAAVFFLATEYPCIAAAAYDAHGRYDESRCALIRQGAHRRPLIHDYANMLWTVLQQQAPALQRRPLQPSLRFSFDIDLPWKYLHKGAAISLGSLLKQAARGQFGALFQHVRTLAGGKDPFDTWAFIESGCVPENTPLFFLVERRSPRDSRYTWRNPAYRSLIRRLSEQGYPIGLHPSYETYLRPDFILEECEALARITGRPVHHSRQHFLRYRLPDTFRGLLDAGIRHEYSPGFYSTIGFRTGMAVPYPWFDLHANEITPLTLHPFMAMDTTLRQYMGLEPDQALEQVLALAALCRQSGGEFVCLLHNNSLSDDAEWKGWRAPLLKLTGMSG